MYFLDYYGPADLYDQVRDGLRQELAASFRASPALASIRRIVTNGELSAVELWVELSSEEQLVRLGRAIADRLTAVIRSVSPIDVWVLFRIVPLSHAFLNGAPRGRARPWSE